MRLGRIAVGLMTLLLAGVVGGCAHWQQQPGTTSQGTPVPLYAEDSRLAFPLVHGKTGRPAAWGELLESARDAEVILIGEQHTDALGHELQLKLYRDILAIEPHTALSLEFLERNEQGQIDRYLAGQSGRVEFIRATASADAAGTTGSWVRFYQPLVDAAAETGARVIGANPPRRLARLAREKGYDALRALPADEQPWFSLPVSRPSRSERNRFLEEMIGSAIQHGAPKDTKVTAAEAAPFLRAQELWNATMAQSILNARQAGAPKVVQIVGGFHIDQYGGLVRELRARQRGLRVLTVQLVANSTETLRGRADYVVRTAPPAGYPARIKDETSTHAETLDLAAADLPRYDLTIDLEPTSHTLRGSLRLEFSAQQNVLPLQLDRNATITRITAAGARLVNFRTHRRKSDQSEGADYFVQVDPLVSRPELHIDWEAVLHQDPSAGEAAGAIHNFTMRASIGNEGVYLTGPWYPTLATVPLGNYRLSLNRPDGLQLVSAGERLTSPTATRDTWHTPYPIDNLALVGGPNQVHASQWQGLEIELHLSPGQAGLSESLTRSVARYLARYEPLLGPLPTRQYRVVNNFFSSGFAFPGFTLLSSGVIEMGPVSQTGHGYIDHEFVHTWFGTGIQSDRSTGDWCEALTSFNTNYYGFLLDGDPAGARKYRRDSVAGFNKLTPEEDLPLDQFGRNPKISRVIGYNKGALVFHLLEQQIGTDAFFTTLRRLNHYRTGTIVGWSDLQAEFEKTSDQDLAWFFDQWVHRGGVPDLRVASAEWDAAARAVTLTFKNPSQFRVSVPFTLRSGRTTTTLTAEVHPGDRQLTLKALAQRPDALQVDPDYLVLRRLNPEELIPTLDLTRRAPHLLSLVLPEEAEAARPFLELFTASHRAGEFRAGASAGAHVDPWTDLTRTDVDWSSAGLVLFGSALRSPAGQAVLAQAQSPVKFLPNGFSYKGRNYTNPNHAILVSLRHPSRPGLTLTLLLANSPVALPKASNLPFYPNSLVIFEGQRPSLRDDLELHPLIPVGERQAGVQ